MQLDDEWAGIPGGYQEAAELQDAEEEAARARNVQRDAEQMVKYAEAKEIAKRLLAEKAALERGPLSARVHDMDGVRNLALPKHLIRHVLYTGSVAVVLGDSQVGKSWVTQAIAACAAVGLNWPSMTPNSKGAFPVLYIAAEDGGAIKWRLMQWEAAHGRQIPRENFYAFTEPINLLDETVIDELCEFIRAKGIRIVVADTVSATFGGEEESNPEFARLVRHCRRLTAAMQPHGGGSAVLNHHFGKDKEKGGRGGSSLFNDCDIVWELTGTIDDITMTNKKWKVDEKRRPFRLKLDKTDRDQVHLVENRESNSHDVSDAPDEYTILTLEIERACRELRELNQQYGPSGRQIMGLIRERGGKWKTQIMTDHLATMVATRRLQTHDGPRRAVLYRLPDVQQELID